jgi:hypothetical protein
MREGTAAQGEKKIEIVEKQEKWDYAVTSSLAV